MRFFIKFRKVSSSCRRRNGDFYACQTATVPRTKEEIEFIRLAAKHRGFDFAIAKPISAFRSKVKWLVLLNHVHSPRRLYLQWNLEKTVQLQAVG